jgi:orotate phosphoribosyltransferase
MEPLRFPANKLTSRARAFQLIKERSFFRKKITLVSCRETDFYFDMKPTMFHPEGAALLAELLLHELQGVSVDYVGGLAVGAVPLVSPLGLESFRGGRPINGFFVRRDVKDHGTKRLVEGLKPGETLAGKSVVILEDVTTTGGSALTAVQAARDAGGTVVLVLSVVDRQEGAEAAFAEAGVPFRSIFIAAEFLAAS